MLWQIKNGEKPWRGKKIKAIEKNNTLALLAFRIIMKQLEASGCEKWKIQRKSYIAKGYKLTHRANYEEIFAPILVYNDKEKAHRHNVSFY